VISKNFSEIVVGIRSALIEGSMITVYGGAGIVAGSIAEEEWIETGTKMRPFIKVINKSVI
jgi:isochorismate synthase EntC